jgi:glycogen phosphorylase
MSGPAFEKRLSGQGVSDTLRELALDLRWCFDHSADAVWEWLDRELWEETHNPWIILQTVSRDKLQAVAKNLDFQKLLTRVNRERRVDETSEGWFQTTYPHPSFGGVAYFSM